MKISKGICLVPTARAEKLVRELVRATNEKAWVGTYHPSDRKAVLKAYKCAGRKLMDYITELENGA